jgi:hypothetical protein
LTNASKITEPWITIVYLHLMDTFMLCEYCVTGIWQTHILTLLRVLSTGDREYVAACLWDAHANRRFRHGTENPADIERWWADVLTCLE